MIVDDGGFPVQSAWRIFQKLGINGKTKKTLLGRQDEYAEREHRVAKVVNKKGRS